MATNFINQGIGEWIPGTRYEVIYLF